MRHPELSAERILLLLFVGWPAMFAFVAVVIYVVFLHG